MLIIYLKLAKNQRQYMFAKNNLEDNMNNRQDHKHEQISLIYGMQDRQQKG